MASDEKEFRLHPCFTNGINLIRSEIESAQKTSTTTSFERITFFHPKNSPFHANIFYPMNQPSTDKKSLVIFQAGPVQTFIAAARSTRDFWSGSYMLSYLMAAAAAALVSSDRRNAVDETIVFPRLSELGVYKLCCRKGTEETEKNAPELLNPAMPNRFLAIVPADVAKKCAAAAEAAFRSEFKSIADDVWLFLKEKKGAKDAWQERWDKQIEQFPEITWQTCPAEAPSGKFTYKTAFTRCQKLLAARRNTREFDQTAADADAEGTPKDALTGREEIIGDKKFQENLWAENERDKGPYGAISIIKRFWHEEFLRKKHFTSSQNDFYKEVSYNSVPDIARENSDENNPYVAVIAMDGDQMGKWMNGDRMLEKTSDLQAHHKEFSKRLAKFSNCEARSIVRKYKGQLVYAGGDDVLAMLPAERVFDCVCELRDEFKKCIGKDRSGSPADVSCGIAIAHKEYPLQRMIKEAQKAESRAKNEYSRSAFAFSLLKRGGEIIHWGGKWSSADNPESPSPERRLFKIYCECQHSGCISARFPYALSERIAPYALDKGRLTVAIDDISQILEKEIKAVLDRQLLREEEETRTELQVLCKNYIDSLKAPQRCLGDFVKLFLTTAFIYRNR